METDFEKELGRLINRYSVENESNTPDFILAQYMRECLDAFNKASNRREQWFGKGLRVGGSIVRIDAVTGKEIASRRVEVSEPREDCKTWD